jgi:hypothetical protein
MISHEYAVFVILLVGRPSSVVRFRLPLTPPQGTEMPPKKALYREVGTKEPSPSVPKVNASACPWKKVDLALLGVDYQFASKIPICRRNFAR